MYIVCHNTRLDVFENLVDVDYMHTWILDKNVCIFAFYRNHDLFTRWSFNSHINFQFGFVLAINNFLYYFDFFVLEFRKGLLDFQCFPSNISGVSLPGRYLHIWFGFLIDKLLFFEIFWYFINFFSQFCQDGRRESWNTRGMGYIRFFSFDGFLYHLWAELWFDVIPKRMVSTIN